MKVTYRSILVAGIVGILFGLAVFLLIPSQIGEEFTATGAIDSRTMPYLLCAVCVLCGVGLVIQSLVLKKDVKKTMDMKKEGKALLYMLVLVVYAVLFSFSFLLATAFVGVMTLVFSGTKKVLYYAIVLVTVVVLYLLFTQVLHVRLP